MDANRHRFWMIDRAAQLETGAGTHWSAGCRALALAGSAPAAETAQPRSQALALAGMAPVAADAAGNYAWTDGTDILAAGVAEEPVLLVSDPLGGMAVSDMAMTPEGVLVLCGGSEGNGRVALVDCRGRWAIPAVLDLPGLQPDRIAVSGPAVWVLERSGGRVFALAGMPLSDHAARFRAFRRFQPETDYLDPPRLIEQAPVGLAPNERIADAAASPEGMLAVLVLSHPNARRAHAVFRAPGGAETRLELPQRGFPGCLGWLGPRRLAAIYPGAPAALGFDIGPGEAPQEISLAPARLPLRARENARLCRGASWPVPVTAGAAEARPQKPVPLRALSLPGYAASGTARLADPFDCGSPGAEWHRLVIEAVLPPGCGLAVDLAAADSPEELAEAPRWRHVFGGSEAGPDIPRGAWLGEASELPHHPGLLGTAPERDRAGAFSVLVQRGGMRDRALRGRYLAVELTLAGTGQATPKIAALRAYAERFSLVENYLPPVFRKRQDADPEAAGPADGADFYDRFAALFEHQLTRIEDKVAAAYLLTAPEAAPPAAMDWLAGWIGLSLAPGLPETARRQMLAAGTWLHRRRGTLEGMARALDIATGGEVTRGGIVIIEDFRLRRTFATILGADYGRREDPILAGFVESGNSIVGPGLFLGDGTSGGLGEEERAELLSLYFGAESDLDAAAVFAKLAFQVTVLVHADLPDAAFGLVRRIADELAPAHVALRFATGSQPLRLGLYSLLAVDTYLRPRPGLPAIRVDETILGEAAHVRAAPALDPRTNPGETP
ncbi:phage tail protein [Mangrovicoccus sp. HB161399]|uniref:phage tail protein n=1 Tax=Mangrovicoccus sp. HB161399 TaxID=2720392 RepID=UPI001557EA00|nr:phage tail protein [Mangrovicoccus sp. HB161399]